MCADCGRSRFAYDAESGMRWNIQKVTAVNSVANARTYKSGSTQNGKPSSVRKLPLRLLRVAPALSTDAEGSELLPARKLRLAARYPSSGFEVPLRLQAHTAPELLEVIFDVVGFFLVALMAQQPLAGWHDEASVATKHIHVILAPARSAVEPVALALHRLLVFLDSRRASRPSVRCTAKSVSMTRWAE